MNLEDCYANHESKRGTLNLLDEKIYLIVVFKEDLPKATPNKQKQTYQKALHNLFKAKNCI